MVIMQLTDWQMAGFWPYTPIFGASMETGQMLSGVTGSYPAKVPGSVYSDLLRAGVIEDPYYEMNSLKCEWVPQRWWVYTTTLKLDESYKGKRLFLNFSGVDYKSRFYFNGKFICDHENMYTPVKIDITETAKYGDEENIIRVVLESAPDEMGQIGYTSQTWTQKARFTYKWDFATRLPMLGIWDKVTIECDEGSTFEETHVRYIDGKVTVNAVTGGGTIKAKLSYDGALVAEAEGESALEMAVEKPNLWWPNGYGDQPLYDLELTLIYNGKVSDVKNMKVGLRTLEYARCDGAVDYALPYIPVVNGKKIYIKGVNCTPFDHMYGCVDAERYDKMLSLAKWGNVNLIRVWGGGIIEKEEFYELCDKYGIMVWQEFIQSSSGVDNVPSERPEFLENCAKTAEYAVRVKRNHVSLTYWSGGNELFERTGEPAKYTNKNIAMLKEIANRLDPDRLMLPTSASGPIGWQDNEHPELNHDIHGPWKYAGVEGHYSLYNNSPIQLHSEFGVDGMSNLASINTILAPVNRKVTTIAENLTWRHHGEWWDTYYRDAEIFGEITDLALFCDVSQYIQAEGIRYALEAHRRRAFRNCGCIVWQYNEPWPNVSCTCMVDYYGTPKFAFLFYREAMKALHVSLRYDKLIWKAGETFRGSVFAHDDLGEGYDSIEVNILDDKKNVIKTLTGSEAFDFEWNIEGIERTFYAECILRSGDKVDRNLYMYFVTGDKYPKADPMAAREYIKAYKA